MPTAALFDVDGTLVTFKFDVQGTRKALIDELRKEGLDTSGLSLSSPTQEIVDSARRQTEGGKASVDFASLKAKLFSTLDRFEGESSREATVFPGTRETLLYLRSKSVRLAVLTNSGRKAAHEVLGRAKVSDCFDFVLTREDVETMKPYPEGIQRAIELFALPKQDIFYVGDGVFDIMAAKKAGLKVIGVATGLYTETRLRGEGADYVISSLKQLPGILRV